MALWEEAGMKGTQPYPLGPSLRDDIPPGIGEVVWGRQQVTSGVMVRLCNQTPLPRASTRVSEEGAQNARFKELLSRLTPVLPLPTPR